MGHLHNDLWVGHLHTDLWVGHLHIDLWMGHLHTDLWVEYLHTDLWGGHLHIGWLVGLHTDLLEDHACLSFDLVFDLPCCLLVVLACPPFDWLVLSQLGVPFEVALRMEDPCLADLEQDLLAVIYA